MFIYLVGYAVEKRLLIAVGKNIKEVFGFDVRFSHINLPPSLGYDVQRKQYRARDLLNYLSRIYYPDMLKLVGLFGFDMYEEGLNFVFGLSQLGGRHAVVSVYRLFDKREKVFFERVYKEVNHELGHTFGLLHCKRPGCVMNFSNSLLEVDAKGKFFCEKCNKILPKP